MVVRKLPIRIGAVAHTVDAYPYSLPEGLADGVGVTVLSYNRQQSPFLQAVIKER